MGGHVKIATVISPDLDRVGQSKPGDKTFFKEMTVSEAQEIFKSTQGVFKEANLLT
jgi:allophanate hydrolase subunit 2